jgi:methionyl-tRNA formyltransferase
VPISETDTAASLYFDKLYPLGLDAIAEAVELIDLGRAKPRAQDESRATFQGLVDDAVARVDWSRDAVTIDRLIRGCDPQPGAHALHQGTSVRLFDAKLLPGASSEPSGTVIAREGGALVLAAGGGRLAVGRVRMGDGKKIAAADSEIAPGHRLA